MNKIDIGRVAVIILTLPLLFLSILTYDILQNTGPYIPPGGPEPWILYAMIVGAIVLNWAVWIPRNKIIMRFGGLVALLMIPFTLLGISETLSHAKYGGLIELFSFKYEGIFIFKFFIVYEILMLFSAIALIVSLWFKKGKWIINY